MTSEGRRRRTRLGPVVLGSVGAACLLGSVSIAVARDDEARLDAAPIGSVTGTPDAAGAARGSSVGVPPTTSRPPAQTPPAASPAASRETRTADAADAAGAAAPQASAGEASVPPSVSPTVSPTPPPPGWVAVASNPTAIAFPRLDVLAPIVPVGVLPDGELLVPEDPDVVGWWAAGGGLQSGAGVVVLAGHVDSHRLGAGVFRALRDLQAGDEVLVVDHTGAQHVFVVDGRTQLRKSELALELFTPTDPLRLVLVTCGGRFDPTARRYADNIIVTAILRSPA